MGKIFLIILFLISFQGPFAHSEGKDAFYTLSLSPKGQNSHISPFFTPSTQAYEALNVRVNDQFMALSKRPIMAIYGSCESKSITGLYRFYTSDDSKYLICASSTNLWVGNDNTGDFQKIGQDFSDGERWTFVTYQDIMIGANGAEQPIKYDGKTNVTANTDGHRTASDVVAELGAPFAELNTGSNLDASSWYAYKTATYDGTNYYYSDAVSNPILTGSSVQDISLTDVPLGTTGTQTRYIFRTEGQADRATLVALGNSGYKLVGTIANNTAKTYDDTVADGSLTTAYDSWISSNSALEITPPLAKYAFIHKERLWLARTPSAHSTAFYSVLYKPNYFLADDYFDFRPDDGDEITGLTEFLGLLTIFKTRTIQKLYTDQASDTNWTASAPFSFIGSPAPYSIATTPEGVLYYGREGIYMFTGQASKLVSDAVTDEIRDILESNVANVTGHYYKNEYHLSYTSEELGSTSNNRVLVYDLIRDAYVVDTKDISVFASLDSGSDFGILYMGSSNEDGNIYINESTTNTLTNRFKSQITAGTLDDTRVYGSNNSGHPHLPVGTEKEFSLNLAWDYTIDTWDGAGATIDNLRDTYTGAIIDRPDLNGTWTSEIYRIDAESVSKLVWNEELGANGDVVFDIRFCDDAACSGESFSGAYTDPSGSDLTGVTADTWFQLRATLTTTDITRSPRIYVKNGYLFRLFYAKVSSTKESSVLSYWDSGWRNFDVPYYEKYISRMDVYYTGSIGTINIAYRNIEGDVENEFEIDLTVDTESDIRDEYIGITEGKIYRHWTGYNATGNPSAIGDDWRFVITEDSIDSDFKIHKIEIVYTVEELIR